MYTEYLSKLSVGDTFNDGGTIYTVKKKPFGKWVDVTDGAGNTKSFKGSYRVNVVSQRNTEEPSEDTQIDGLF